ncbi:hypothetical protein [Streptomyces sp. NPDC004267]|uniref:hypothetical protein n=1 Tax=Streptomyces sp. NPDC004267 TaxID=3364694 RepID=UPI0036B39D0A
MADTTPCPASQPEHPLQYGALALADIGYDPEAIAETTGRQPSTIRYLIAPHALRAETLLLAPAERHTSPPGRWSPAS